MKVIHVVGRSGSGKTPFIADLIRALKDRGAVAAVKHLGHHAFKLDERKDTTQFAEAGAAYSVGVDSQKTVYIARSAELTTVLSTLCGQGVAYAVIEGFKTHSFPKVVIGDLEIENCMLRNPSIPEVLTSLDLFEEYVTLPGIARELETACGGGGVMLTWSSSSARRDGDHASWRRLVPVEREIGGMNGIRGVRIYVAPEGGNGNSVLIGILAVDSNAALCSLEAARELLACRGTCGERTGE